jgi:hypothetical protein
VFHELLFCKMLVYVTAASVLYRVLRAWIEQALR